MIASAMFLNSTSQSYVNERKATNEIYMWGEGGEICSAQIKTPENYYMFRLKAKKSMHKLLEKANPKIRKRVDSNDLEQIIVGIYDGSEIYSQLADMRYVEIAKFYHESGFVKDIIHQHGEKGIGAIKVSTGIGLLNTIRKDVNSMSKESFRKLNPKTQNILNKIKKYEINSKNISDWLVKDYIFNIICSMCYDNENLNYFSGDVHLAIRAYQRGKWGTVQNNYLKRVMSVHNQISEESFPRYIITEQRKRL